MFWRPPNEKDLNVFGLRSNDYKAPEIDVWPENWPAIKLYVDNRTQTIQGPGGPVGLNYSWFQSCMERQRLDVEEAGRVMEGLRTIEGAMLELVYEDE